MIKTSPSVPRPGSASRLSLGGPLAGALLLAAGTLAAVGVALPSPASAAAAAAPLPSAFSPDGAPR